MSGGEKYSGAFDHRWHGRNGRPLARACEGIAAGGTGFIHRSSGGKGERRATASGAFPSPHIAAGGLGTECHRSERDGHTDGGLSGGRIGGINVARRNRRRDGSRDTRSRGGGAGCDFGAPGKIPVVSGEGVGTRQDLSLEQGFASFE